MRQTRWAVLGTGAIALDFVRALEQSRHGVLAAVGSGEPDRAAGFARDHSGVRAGRYEDVIEDDSIDAVYIGTVHTTHVELSTAALDAGKGVLCEKPASVDVESLDTVIHAARASGMPFVEAYKYRFSPLWDRLLDLLPEIGELRELHTGFGFAAAPREGRLFDPALGGGAILDAGGYPASLVAGIAAAGGVALGRVDTIEANSGLVDESSTARIVCGTLQATVRTSIVSGLPRSATFYGSAGRLSVADVWGGRARSADTLLLHRDGQDPLEYRVPVVQPMAAEADAVSCALAQGATEVPQMPWADSLSTARLLDEWRSGVRSAAERSNRAH